MPQCDAGRLPAHNLNDRTQQILLYLNLLADRQIAQNRSLFEIIQIMGVVSHEYLHWQSG